MVLGVCRPTRPDNDSGTPEGHTVGTQADETMQKMAVAAELALQFLLGTRLGRRRIRSDPDNGVHHHLRLWMEADGGRNDHDRGYREREGGRWRNRHQPSVCRASQALSPAIGEEITDAILESGTVSSLFSQWSRFTDLARSSGRKSNPIGS